LQHQNLIDSVRRRSSLSGSDTLQVAIGVVVDALVRHLDDAGRERLADVLPTADQNGLRWEMATRQPPDTGLVKEIARNTGYPPELARTLTDAVIDTLAEADPKLREVVHAQLGEEA
jgi:hypothetical protein